MPTQNSTLDICAVEAVKLDDLDAAAVQSGKQQAESELAKQTVSSILQPVHPPTMSMHPVDALKVEKER